MNTGSASSPARWLRNQEIKAEVRAALSPQFFCGNGHRHPSTEERDRCQNGELDAATVAGLAQR